MKQIALVAAVVALVAVSAPGWAADFDPPNWRGISGSQTVQWEFLAPPTNSTQNANGSYSYTAPGYAFFTPDCSIQYGWTPAFSPTLKHTPGPGAGWWPKQPTSFALGASGIYDPAGVEGDGWVNLSGDLLIHLPDTQIANPTKEIWLQLTWEPQSASDIPSVWYDAGDCTPNSNAPYLKYQAAPLVDTIVWGPGVDQTYPFRAVHQTVFHFDLSPNPTDETIYIRGGINVDEIVIDTRCGTVPEPATLSLLGLGIVPVIWRRFKK